MSNISTSGSGLQESFREAAQKVCVLAGVPTIGILAYLIYALVTGQLAEAAHGKDHAHALEVIRQLSLYMNIGLVVTLISAILVFYEVEQFGFILVALAGFLAYGFRYLLDFLGSQHLATGAAADALFSEFQFAAIIIGAPGILHVLKEIVFRVLDSRSRQDLTKLKYGKDSAGTEGRPQALIGAFAACWQLPFCRDGIRVRCPIFHARTRCWKQRVGCMCEENIILLAMGGAEKEGQHDMTAPTSAGFVPIGDLLSQNNEKTRQMMQTRIGPRGVRIPTNPHLSEAAKRQRCKNCVIFNEHQRQKFNFLSGPVTLIVPLLAVWQYPNLLGLCNSMLHGIDGLVSKFSFTNQSGVASEITRQLSSNQFVETMLIVCMTLVAMTWAQRALEFTCFRLKI